MLLSGKVQGDDLQLNIAQSTFDNKQAGVNKSVNLTGLTLSGADKNNYDLLVNNLNLNATINKATINSIGKVVKDKTYDGNTTAAVDTSNASLSGVLANDQVSVKVDSAVFSDKNAGVNKTVVLNNVNLIGNDAGNYQLVTGLTNTATIFNATPTFSGTPIITPMPINRFENMDLETAMLTVQQERANLLDSQLRNQIKVLQDKNDRVAKLNDAYMAALKLQQQFSSNATADTKIPDGTAKVALDVVMANTGFTTQLTNRGELDQLISNIKLEIDSQSNSQQMDMLRLQSLSNKRNEAFDLMNNFMKKMLDSRNSVVGNMR